MEKHGRLLQTLVIASGDINKYFAIGGVFLKYAGSASELDIRET